MKAQTARYVSPATAPRLLSHPSAPARGHCPLIALSRAGNFALGHTPARLVSFDWGRVVERR